jgi:hypothetical protein
VQSVARTSAATSGIASGFVENPGVATLNPGYSCYGLEHGLTMVTRNVSDFAPTGVAVVNPFDS